jgi:hypothetical protein
LSPPKDESTVESITFDAQGWRYLEILLILFWLCSVLKILRLIVVDVRPLDAISNVGQSQPVLASLLLHGKEMVHVIIFCQLIKLVSATAGFSCLSAGVSTVYLTLDFFELAGVISMREGIQNDVFN